MQKHGCYHYLGYESVKTVSIESVKPLWYSDFFNSKMDLGNKPKAKNAIITVRC